MRLAILCERAINVIGPGPFLPILTYKVIFLLVSLTLMILVPTFESGEFGRYYQWIRPDSTATVLRLTPWRSSLYIHLAENGYEEGSETASLAPLWPTLIAISTYLTGASPSVAALVLANGFSLAALVCAHSFVRRVHGNTIANRTIFFLLLSPGAIFLACAEAQPLILLLSTILVSALKSHRYGITSLAGFLLSCTVSWGLLCILPVTVYVLAHKPPRWVALNLVYGPVAGFAVLLIVWYAFIGDPFYGFKQVGPFGSPALADVFISPLNVCGSMGETGSSPRSAMSMLEIIFFLTIVPACFLLWRFDVLYLALFVAMWLIPTILEGFSGAIRNLSVCVPFFVLLSYYLEGAELRSLLVAAALGSCQAALLVRQLNFLWAG